MSHTPVNRPTYAVADYLLDRLAELGVDTMFGVPGRLHPRAARPRRRHRTIAWTGCTNELNAGYAADGYGRLRGIAALCTTFGVGRAQRDQRDRRQLRRARARCVHVVGAPSSGGPDAQPDRAPHPRRRRFTPLPGRCTPTITCARAALTADERGRRDRPGAGRGPRPAPARLSAAAGRRRRGPGRPAGCAAAAARRRHRPEALAEFAEAARRLLARGRDGRRRVLGRAARAPARRAPAS